MTDTQRPRIVILGAGFAGIHAARELTRLLPKDEDGDITLVNQNNYLLFTPMLTEVVGGQVETGHIISAARRLSPRVTSAQGRVDGIDVDNKRVTITLGQDEDGIPTAQRTLDADHLVIALGSVTSFHGIPGTQEHSLTIKSVGDAAAIRNRALELLERADDEGDPARRRDLLTIVVGGGGYSGVETMAALNDLVRDAAKRHYPQIAANDIRTVLVQPGARLLPEISAGLASYTHKKLQERGVEVILDTKITGAGPDWVELEDKNGQKKLITTHLLVWAAGVTPNPVIKKLDVKRGHHHGIVVDTSLAVPGHPGVWALGDCAEIPKPNGKASYAPTAQNATREGTQVARNIVATLRGQQPQPFVYTPIGSLAIIGKRTGAAEVYGRHFSGILAWAMWRAIYLAKTPLLGKRVRVGLDWTLDALFGTEIVELPVARSRTVGDDTQHGGRGSGVGGRE